MNVIAHKTKFLGIGVPSRPGKCPHCSNEMPVDSVAFCDEEKWLGYATLFCSEECLQAGHLIMAKEHHVGGHMIKW